MCSNWTSDSVQRDKFFDAVEEKIDQESKYQAKKYGVGLEQVGDISSEIRLALLEKMEQGAPIFEESDPESAASKAVETYRIRELARSSAKKIQKIHSRQADMLADVRLSMPEEKPGAELMQVARTISEIANATDFTPREDQIFRLEACRRAGIDELEGAADFDLAAEEAGLTSDDLRTHLDAYEEQNLSCGDRKAWSRAKERVSSTFTRAGLISLFLIAMNAVATFAHQINGI